MNIISKSAARAAGFGRYFTGKPCRQGHIAERYLKGHCVVCERLQQNKWNRANADKRREYRLVDMERHREKRLSAKRADSKSPRAKAADRMRRTGWTQERYEVALVEQDGRCAISGQVCEVLHADHDHLTRSPRALLDPQINLGLGSFSDNPEWLYNAAVYVLTHKPLGEWVSEYAGGRAF